MRLPGFSADRSLERGAGLYRTAGLFDDSIGREQVLPQQKRTSKEECWRRCIWTPWDCPTECWGVPWPTLPPSERRRQMQ
jgi:hypothetical protein